MENNKSITAFESEVCDNLVPFLFRNEIIFKNLKKLLYAVCLAFMYLHELYNQRKRRWVISKTLHFSKHDLSYLKYFI